MSHKPTISVLMGIYNCSRYLEQAVACIQAQTYQDWELIMCDDCSTDNTYKLAVSLAEKDSRIKLLKNEQNITLAPTLNKCLKLAQGKYIARMDGDDLCSPTRFTEELDFLETHEDFALVSTHMKLFDERGVYRTIQYKEFPAPRDFLHGSPFCHAGCMMRKKVLIALGGYDTSKARQRVEDFDLWVRLYAAGYKGYNIKKALYSMRDDREAIKRRSLKNRVNESAIIYLATRKFSLGIKGYLFSMIPIIKFITPNFVYSMLHRNKLS